MNPGKNHNSGTVVPDYSLHPITLPAEFIQWNFFLFGLREKGENPIFGF